MKLFDDIARNNLEKKSLSESNFSYLNRSARLEHQRIRELLEQWFKDFPASEDNKIKVRNNFRSKDDSQHLGAFYELYCYHLLRSQGFEVEYEEIADETKEKRPDFTVKLNDKTVFYMECTIAAEATGDYGEQKRTNWVYDYLENHLWLPDFFIIIQNIKIKSDTSPSASDILSSIKEKLQELTPEMDEILNYQGSRTLDNRIKGKDKAWELVFSVHPKPLAVRNKPEARTVIPRSPSYMWGDEKIAQGLLKKLEGKAKGYGKINYPYVIAVNGTKDFPFNDKIIAIALFGAEELRGHTGEMKILKYRDVFWHAHAESSHLKVSAALIVSHLVSSRFTTKIPVLWHNPWAEKPLDPELWQGPQIITYRQESKIYYQHKDGLKGYEILGLSPNWPLE